ncbi:SWAP/Surp [Pseudocohnilembus persalinus]|uniref:SWAP/Surp n=1 Tax=Pseudocohnilembus persalinus TaxID=266149 RepID=A0A0V0QIS1_PSEPJ|nr:SWAP/Surp [Pseudocohnilembus persalinus]|eukprot:KRX02211.1 SWAP/Surp [Pseudocohnilembus persalinus]
MNQDDQNVLASFKHSFKNDQNKGSGMAFVRGGIQDPSNKDSDSDDEKEKKRAGQKSKQAKNIDLFREQLKQQQPQRLELNVIAPASQRNIKKKVNTDSENQYLAMQNLKKSITHAFADTDQERYLVILNMRLDIDEDMLKQYLEKFGEVEQVQKKAIYYYDDLEIQAKIVGYVTFKDKSSAQKLKKNQIALKQLGEKALITEPYKEQILVQFPENTLLRRFIDRFARLVQQDGYGVEQFIQENHKQNLQYAFLFCQNCPEHIYYKWRLYSFMQGNTEKSWSENPFQMTSRGPIWIPPAQDHQDISVAELIDKEAETSIKQKAIGKTPLSQEDKQRLEDTIRKMNTTRTSIGETMLYCMDQYNSACDIIITITQSIDEALGNKDNLASQFYEKISKVLNVWAEWSLFDINYLAGLGAILIQNPKKFKIVNGLYQYQYDNQKGSGVKLRNLENQLNQYDVDDLQRKAHQNGLQNNGTKDLIIARLIMFEEYNLNKLNMGTKRDLIFNIEDPNDKIKAIQCVQSFNNVLYKTQSGTVEELEQFIQEGVKVLNFCEQRNLILEQCDDIDGQPIDEIDNILYDLNNENDQKRQVIQSIQIGKSSFKEQEFDLTEIEGEDLTLEEIKMIYNEKCNFFCFHNIDYLYRGIDTSSFIDGSSITSPTSSSQRRIEIR